MQQLIDAVSALLTGVEYAQEEMNANYVITARDIDMLKQALQQCSVSGRSEQLPDFKDQLVTNSSIGQLLAKIHDDIEGRYNLDVGDLQDVENILMLCQFEKLNSNNPTKPN